MLSESFFSEIDEQVFKGWVSSMGSESWDVEETLNKIKGTGPGRIADYLLQNGPYQSENLSIEKLKANPHGIDLGALKPRIPEILRTASKKIELTPDPFVDDVERLKEKMHPQEKMLLISRRHIKSNNSWFHNYEDLNEGKNRIHLFMHPDDASDLSISQDEKVKITSKNSQITAPVDITDSIIPGVVSLPYGWSEDDEMKLEIKKRFKAANTNLLPSPDEYDLPSGNAVLNGVEVKIEKI